MLEYLVDRLICANYVESVVARLELDWHVYQARRILADFCRRHRSYPPALWSPVTLKLAHVSLTSHDTIWTILLLNSRQNIPVITGGLSDLKCDAPACSASADSLRVAGRCSRALERLSPASPQAPTLCDMLEERSTSLQLLLQSRRVRWAWTPRSSRSRVMHQASCSPSSPLPSSAFTPV